MASSSNPVVTDVIGAVAGDTLRYLADAGVVREVEITGDIFTDTWLWQPDGQYLRAEVVSERQAGENKTRLELEAFGLTPTDADLGALLALPRLRALATPVFIDQIG